MARHDAQVQQEANKAAMLVQAPVPPGYKRIGWEGVSMVAPQRWDLGRHYGDSVLGGCRIDSEHRPVVHLQWWRNRGQVNVRRALKRYLPAHVQPKDQTLSLPTDALYEASIFSVPVGESGEDEDLLVIGQDLARQRGVLMRLEVRRGHPDVDRVLDLMSSLRIYAPDQWRQWGMLEFAVQSPPGYMLWDPSLGAGLCHLRFTRGRRRYVGLRRYAAARELLNRRYAAAADLEKAVRLIYAGEFYDMDYRIDRLPPDEHGRIGLDLLAQRHGPSIEWRGLFPRFRNSPQRIVLRYDAENDKLFTFEIRGRHESGVVDGFLDSAVVQYDWSFEEPRDAMRDQDRRIEARLRSLSARVIRNDQVDFKTDQQGVVSITYRFQRPARLRVLRWLSGNSAPEFVDRTTELDRIGSFLWQACDRKQRVSDIIELFMQEYHVSYREAEMSVTSYLRLLGNRRLIVLQVPRN